MTHKNALHCLTVTGAAVHLAGSDSSSCLCWHTHGSVPSAVVPPRHAATWSFACIGARHLPNDVRVSSPREWLLHKVSALLLNLNCEISFRIYRLREVVGLIWDFCPRRNIQLGCSSTITVMRPWNKLLKLKPRVGLGGLTSFLFHQAGGCWSDSVAYHAWCSVLLIIAQGRRQPHSIHSRFRLLLIRSHHAAGGLWCSPCIVRGVDICQKVVFTLN